LPANHLLQRWAQLPLLMSLAACVHLSPQQLQQLSRYDRDITVKQVPFFPQQEDLCGPAALASMLGKAGRHVDPLWLEPQVYLPSRHGSLKQEMMAAARRYGRIAYEIEPRLDALVAELNAGNAVLVLQNLGLSWYPRWHYAVVSAYRHNPLGLVMRTGWDRPREMPMETFAKTWARGGNWAALVLAPGDFPAANDPLRYLQALYRVELAMPGIKPVNEAYRLALQHWPRYLPLRLAQANWLQKAGDWQAAEDALQQLLALAPNYAPANNNLALLLLRKGQAAEALKYSQRALRHVKQDSYRALYLDTQTRIQAALSDSSH